VKRKSLQYSSCAARSTTIKYVPESVRVKEIVIYTFSIQCSVGEPQTWNRRYVYWWNCMSL